MTHPIRTAVRLLACASLVLGSAAVADEDSPGSANLGSPNAVENQLADDARLTGSVLGDRIVQPWFDWKGRLQEEHGFGLGADYTAVFLGASEAGLSGEDGASSGIARIFGAWQLVGRGTPNSGAFVWK